MTAVPIKVSLTKGLVQCDPCYAHVHPGHTIDWNCAKNFPFAIHLGYDSPFASAHHQSYKQHIRLEIPENIPCGRYKYTIAVSDGEKVWIEDPEFIIRR